MLVMPQVQQLSESTGYGLGQSILALAYCAMPAPSLGRIAVPSRMGFRLRCAGRG
jgi:hypothetical protein